MKVLFIFYDNQRRDNILPLGTVYIAGYLKKCLPEVDIEYYCQDVYHYSEEHLTQYLKENHFDVAAVGFCAGYYQHTKIKQICDAIHLVPDRPLIVIGGHGPSGCAEYFKEHTGADVVLVGEAEKQFVSFIKTGTVGIYENDPIKHLDELPFPYLKNLPMEHYTHSTYLTSSLDRGIGMVSGRGCPYHCNFCYRLEHGIRLRSADNIADEIEQYKKDYHINFIWFWDELWMASERRAFELAETFLERNLNIKFFCTGRLNIVNNKILKIMKRAGCSAIDYGIEQFDNRALRAMNKQQTEDQIENGITLTLENKIQPLFNIIWGNIGDTKASLRKSLDFLKKYNDYGQIRVIRPVTPYPGSPLFDYCLENGLLKDAKDFYTKHKNLELLTVNMTQLSDNDFYDSLFNANKEIITDYYSYMQEKAIEQFQKVYTEKDYSFRGLRH